MNSGAVTWRAQPQVARELPRTVERGQVAQEEKAAEQVAGETATESATEKQRKRGREGQRRQEQREGEGDRGAEKGKAVIITFQLGQCM